MAFLTAKPRVGRKTSVRIVATSNPPKIAKAIGPQNTVGAIGIKPRTVDTAVSMIGRNRVLLASITALFRLRFDRSE